MGIKMELLCIKFLSVVHSALKEPQCIFQKWLLLYYPMITTVLSWDFILACDLGMGDWQSSV